MSAGPNALTFSGKASLVEDHLAHAVAAQHLGLGLADDAEVHGLERMVDVGR